MHRPRLIEMTLRRLSRYCAQLPYMVRIGNKLVAVYAGRAQYVKTAPLLSDGKHWVLTQEGWLRR